MSKDNPAAPIRTGFEDNFLVTTAADYVGAVEAMRAEKGEEVLGETKTLLANAFIAGMEAMFTSWETSKTLANAKQKKVVWEQLSAHVEHIRSAPLPSDAIN